MKTNSSVREFCAPPSKTADSKIPVVSVTRAEVMLCVGELIVEQNIPLPCLLLVARTRSRVGTNVSR